MCGRPNGVEPRSERQRSRPRPAPAVRRRGAPRSGPAVLLIHMPSPPCWLSVWIWASDAAPHDRVRWASGCGRSAGREPGGGGAPHRCPLRRRLPAGSGGNHTGPDRAVRRTGRRLRAVVEGPLLRARPEPGRGPQRPARLGQFPGGTGPLLSARRGGHPLPGRVRRPSARRDPAPQGRAAARVGTRTFPPAQPPGAREHRLQRPPCRPGAGRADPAAGRPGPAPLRAAPPRHPSPAVRTRRGRDGGTSAARHPRPRPGRLRRLRQRRGRRPAGQTGGTPAGNPAVAVTDLARRHRVHGRLPHRHEQPRAGRPDRGAPTGPPARSAPAHGRRRHQRAHLPPPRLPTPRRAAHARPRVRLRGRAGRHAERAHRNPVAQPHPSADGPGGRPDRHPRRPGRRRPRRRTDPARVRRPRHDHVHRRRWPHPDHRTPRLRPRRHRAVRRHAHGRRSHARRPRPDHRCLRVLRRPGRTVPLLPQGPADHRQARLGLPAAAQLGAPHRLPPPRLQRAAPVHRR